MSRSVDLIYNAITRPELWSEVVESIVHDTGSNSGLLCLEKTDQRAILTYSDYGLTSRGMADYADYYVAKDIWLEVLFQQPGNHFHLSHEMARQKDFLNSEIYNDWGTFEHIQHATGVIVDSPGEAALRFCLQRSDREGEYTPEEKAALNSIVPHFRRAIMVHSDLVSLQLLNNSASRILDQMPFAAFLLNEKCRIEYRNGGAERLFAEDCTFRDVGGVLSIDAHRGEFERYVYQSIQAGRGADIPLARALRVGSKAGDPRYEVSVSPLMVDDFQLCFQYQRVLALVIVRSADGANTLPRSVTDAYGLSTAEAEIARWLCAGMNAAQIADTVNRSYHTVRTHIRNILQKTGTSSQAELVAQLISGIAPLAPDLSDGRR